jgi:hypothetical protein
LEIYRADLKTVSTGERAFISFKAAAHAPQFTVSTSAPSRDEQHGAHPLEAVSSAFVHRQLLGFFEWLASEHR